jgi:hypothetical protein
VGTLLALPPILALKYVLFLYPLPGFLGTGQNPAGRMTPRTEDKIFWLAIFAVTVFLLLINRSSAGRTRAQRQQGRPLAERMPRAVVGSRLNVVARHIGYMRSIFPNFSPYAIAGRPLVCDIRTFARHLI